MAEGTNNTHNSPREVIIDPRFEGPTDIALGGCISGFMADYIKAETVEVTMRASTPMGKKLQVYVEAPDHVVMRDGDTLLNEARAAELELEVPAPISLEEATEAAERHIANSFPNCFACGSGRRQDNGLHLRSGPVAGRNLSAIDWTPNPAAVGVAAGEPISGPPWSVPLPGSWVPAACRNLVNLRCWVE